MKISWAASTLAGLAFLMVASAAAVTNEWTKVTSGNWEEPYWSLGLPSTNQQAVAISNPGWKAVAIGPNTIANYPSSLHVHNLIIDAPPDSRNQLLLNWAGLNIPLVVRSNLIIGTNGSLASHHSTMLANAVDLQGVAEYSDSSTTTLEAVTLREKGSLQINDVYLISSYLMFQSGVVTQSQGIAIISNLITQLERNSSGFTNLYALANGRLVSDAVSLGRYDLSGFERCAILQSGGVHTNNSMTIWGGQRHFQQITRVGHYGLSGGLLVSDQTSLYGGTMEQSGGTNHTRELSIAAGGFYTLNAGHMFTSNTTVDTVDCLGLGFTQNGGSHTIQNRLALTDGASYVLSAGTLSAPLIEVNSSAGLLMTGGAISNPGTIVLRRGYITVDGSSQQFGKLQVLDGPSYGCGSEPNAPATLYVGSTTLPAVVRFADSRELSWDGVLYIRNWSTNHAGNGPDQIFVGTSSQALTPGQLGRVVFIRPSGLGSDYSAILTASGELVPAVVHDYDYVITNGTVTITRYTGPGGNITVPSTRENLPVAAIGNSAFTPDFISITSLTSVTLPDTVTNIGDRAFYYCKGLTNINLGNGVLRIGDSAFGDCDNLPNITLPASVRELGRQVFESCDSLVAIDVHPNNLFFSSLDGVLLNKSQTRLLQFPPRKDGSYAVPDTVASIEPYAVYACYYLTNVALGRSVTNIGEWAFAFCTVLTNITIQEGLTTVDDFAFYQCSSLPSITLPDSLSSTGARMFEGCGALTRAEIGRGIKSFGGWHFFASCQNLAGVYFRGDAPEVISDFYESLPTIYYLPGTVGWDPTFAGRPTAPWYLPKPMVLDFGPSFGIRTNRFGFVISWVTNATVVVEGATNLSSPNWSVISSHALSGGAAYFSDPQWTNYVRRFYRLRVQ